MSRMLALLVLPATVSLWWMVPQSATPQKPPPLEFEVAAIHRDDLPMQSLDSVTISGTLVRLEADAPFLIMEAYDVKEYEVSFAAMPKHDQVEDFFYAIAARAPGDRPPTKEQYREMLRSLLADRFKLTIHREAKEMQVYALLPGSKGPRLTENKDAQKCRCFVSGVPGGQKYQFKGCGTDKLVEQLTEVIGRPVLDETQIRGSYDFSFVSGLYYRPRADDISPFTSVHELGFKLKPRKAPIQIIVVDHMEEPTGN